MGLELLGPYLSHVHVKNAAWLENGTSPDGEKLWKHSMVATRDGSVSWPEVLISLDKAGYRGWLSFEDFGPGDTKTKLAEDLAYVKGLADRLAL